MKTRFVANDETRISVMRENGYFKWNINVIFTNVYCQ